MQVYKILLRINVHFYINYPHFFVDSNLFKSINIMLKLYKLYGNFK
jgi:hypothetical protein